MIRLACEHTPRQLSCYSTYYCSLNQAYTCVAGSLVQYYHSKLNSMQISRALHSYSSDEIYITCARVCVYTLQFRSWPKIRTSRETRGLPGKVKIGSNWIVTYCSRRHNQVSQQVRVSSCLTSPHMKNAKCYFCTNSVQRGKRLHFLLLVPNGPNIMIHIKGAQTKFSKHAARNELFMHFKTLIENKRTEMTEKAFSSLNDFILSCISL